MNVTPAVEDFKITRPIKIIHSLLSLYHSLLLGFYLVRVVFLFVNGMIKAKPDNLIFEVTAMYVIGLNG